jgi:hypothetical protein
VKKHSQKTPINEIQVVSDENWKQTIRGKLTIYRKKAPFFRQTLELIEECFSNNEFYISHLNVSIREKLCYCLDIPFDFSYLSEMELNLGNIRDPGDWALEISKALGAREYINPAGGAGLYNRMEFHDAGIKLTIQKYENLIYDCEGFTFVPALSIIDVLMWNPLGEIKNYLRRQF